MTYIPTAILVYNLPTSLVIHVGIGTYRVSCRTAKSTYTNLVNIFQIVRIICDSKQLRLVTFVQNILYILYF